MVVWVVFAQCYEDAWVQAVFSTYERALRHVEALKKELLTKPYRRYSMPGLEYIIEQHEVDSEEA